MQKRFKCLDVMWAPPFGVLPLLQFLPVSVAQRRCLPWLWSREASSLWCASPVAYRPLASPGGRMVSVCLSQERLSGWYDSYLTCERMHFRFWAEGGPTSEDSVRRPPAADLQRWEDRRSLLHLHGLECIWRHLQGVQPAGLWYMSASVAVLFLPYITEGSKTLSASKVLFSWKVWV